MNLAKLKAASRMRSLAGQTIARQGTGADGYMRKYMTYRASGGRCMESGDVEGKAAPQRMDRPGRKAGGRACKADGGDVDKSPPNPGEVSDAESAKYLRSKSKSDAKEAVGEAAKGAISIGLGRVIRGLGKEVPGGPIERGIGKTLEYGNYAGGASNIGAAIGKGMAAKRHSDEADKFEDRKNGGAAYAKGGFLKGMKKGALHREMGVPEGEKIPAKKLEKAEHSDNPKLRKRAVLAESMRHWDHHKSRSSK